jgi:hypothetical protein
MENEQIEEMLAYKAEKLLDEMLKFLAKMPIDKHHDFRIFRHNGLRGYLINRFLRERTNIVNECKEVVRV